MTQTSVGWIGGILSFSNIPLNIDELFQLGYQIINEPVNLYSVAIKAMYNALIEEKKARTSKVLEDKVESYKEVSKLVGIPEASKQCEKYKDYI